jgi:hypothetical protein
LRSAALVELDLNLVALVGRHMVVRLNTHNVGHGLIRRPGLDQNQDALFGRLVDGLDHQLDGLLRRLTKVAQQSAQFLELVLCVLTAEVEGCDTGLFFLVLEDEEDHLGLGVGLGDHDLHPGRILAELDAVGVALALGLGLDRGLALLGLALRGLALLGLGLDGGLDLGLIALGLVEAVSDLLARSRNCAGGLADDLAQVVEEVAHSKASRFVSHSKAERNLTA